MIISSLILYTHPGVSSGPFKNPDFTFGENWAENYWINAHTYAIKTTKIRA